MENENEEIREETPEELQERFRVYMENERKKSLYIAIGFGFLGFFIIYNIFGMFFGLLTGVLSFLNAYNKNLKKDEETEEKVRREHNIPKNF